MVLSTILIIISTVFLFITWVIYWRTSFFAKLHNLSIFIIFIFGFTYVFLAIVSIITYSSFLDILLACCAILLGFFHITLAGLKLSQVDSKYRWIHYHNRATIDYGRDHDKFSIITPDGIRIEGIGLINYNSSKPSKAIIVCHGASRSKNTAPIVQTCLILAEQYDVFSFDFRGHMESGGICYANGDEIDIDLQSVVSYVKKKGYEKIAVFGWSIGGAAALRTASKGAEIDAIIVGSPAIINISNLPELQILNRFKFLGTLFLLPMAFLRNAKLTVHSQTNNLNEFLPNLSGIPILLAYNDSDYVLKINADVFDEFYEKLTEPKDRIKLKGRGHLFDWPQTYFLWTKMISWLATHF